MSKWLKSEETGHDFCSCIHCRMPLVELDAPWLVNKEYVGSECVMEYAICQRCRDEVASGFSEESKRGVQQFIEREIDWQERLGEFMQMHAVEERFAQCIACRAERDGLRRFAISAQFDSGGELTVGPLPLLLCGECVERMTAGLSEQTREVWKRFVGEHFAAPPSDSGFPGML